MERFILKKLMDWMNYASAFSGSVNFLCGRLGIVRSTRRVAQKKIMQKVRFYGKIFFIYLHSELYFVHFI